MNDRHRLLALPSFPQYAYSLTGRLHTNGYKLKSLLLETAAALSFASLPAFFEKAKVYTKAMMPYVNATKPETAYAMTVHKSQGSEFHHTVVVLPRESSPVITRELIYTGITRSRKFFTLVTPVSSVFETAIKTQVQRASGLGVVLHNFRYRRSDQ